MGISLIESTAFDRGRIFSNDVLIVYRRVPLLFFVMHFALISLASYRWMFVDFGTGINLAFTTSDARPGGYEPDLTRVYVVWIIVLSLRGCFTVGLISTETKSQLTAALSLIFKFQKKTLLKQLCTDPFFYSIVESCHLRTVNAREEGRFLASENDLSMTNTLLMWQD